MQKKTNDKNMLVHAYHQKGMILQSIYKFRDSLVAYNKSLEIEQEVGNKSGEAISVETIKALKEKMQKKKDKTS